MESSKAWFARIKTKTTSTQLGKNIKALLLVLALAIIYFYTAVWSLQLAFHETNAAPFWPPSGIAFTAMMVFGYRIWPGIWLGAFLANVFVFSSNHVFDLTTSCVLSMFIGVGNTLEAALGVFLLDCFAVRSNPLLRVPDIIKFNLIVMVAALASATTGTVVNGLARNLPWPVFKTVWSTWWLGDVLSILVITPFLLLIFRPPWHSWPLKRFVEAVLIGLVVIVVNSVIFGSKPFFNDYPFPSIYLILPLMVWATYRLGFWGSTITSLTTLIFGFQGTVQGMGPFTSADLNLSLLLLQIFIGIMTMTGLVLAAALHERRIAEEQIRHNSQRFQALVDNSLDMIALLDQNGTIFYASPAITKVLGYPLNEYVGNHILLHVHDDDKAAISLKLMDVFSAPGTIVNGQCRCRHKNGTWCWVDGTAHNLLSEPAINAIVINYRDITQRKESDEARQHMAAIIENSEEAIIGQGLDGTITSWNKGAERLYGYASGEIVGQSSEMLVPDDKKHELVDLMRRLHQKHKVELFETVRMAKGGKPVDVMLTISPIKDASGNWIGASAIAHDITARKKAQMALLESEARFRNMADTAPVMIWMSDADMISTFFNKAWLDFRGQTQEQELGHGWIQGVFPDDVKRCWTTYMHSFRRREKFTMDYRLKRFDREFRWILATGVPRFTSSHEFAGYIGSCIDITERKMAEEVVRRDKESLELLVDERSKELLATQKELKQASRLADIGTLAATVAHELRNPLGVIQMAAYNLKRKMPNSIIDKHLINIEKKVWEGNRIIDNLLSYSRIKIPTYERINFMNILEECLSSTVGRFEDHNIQVNKHYDGIDVVEADGHQVREIFTNILTNAVQAFHEKSGIIDVTVRREAGDMAAVTFRDNGSGIEADDLGRIFEPFFTRKSKGTGLGLAICNELVNLHQGRIEVKSAKGQGTSITIMLPITRESNEQKDIAH